MELKLIDHIVIIVKDIQATEKFYSSFLGKPVQRDDQHIVYQVGYTALFFALLTVVFFYFFSKGWKTITVGPTGIIVGYVVSRKQIIIPYAEITRMGVYSGLFTSDFVIDYGSRSLAFNPNHYDNYEELKGEVYNYTLGFDRHRSQY